MDQARNLDASTLSFDRFVEFYFQRPENEEYWYQDPLYQSGDCSVSNPRNLIAYTTRLFSEFGVIAKGYSIAQIDHGIWALLVDGPLGITPHLWNSSVPIDERTRCIRSMLHVYSDFVACSEENETETCFYMWWDLLGDDLWSSAGLTEHKEESRLAHDLKTMLDAMFDTLKLILDLPSPYAQRCALHGLGHLHHREVPPHVQKFIDHNRTKLSKDALQWVEQCRDGTVM